jgi:Fe2+ or Zn2+ uptake regulation protein
VPVRPDVHETVAALLGQDGQRYTESRRRLIDILAGAGRPLSIPEVLSADAVAQSSAYRNLVVLEHAGVVERILAADTCARYELAEGIIEHHHHLVCLTCGSPADVTLAPGFERAIEAAVHEVADATGFRPSGHRLDILGLCDRCSDGPDVASTSGPEQRKEAPKAEPARGGRRRDAQY